MLNVSAQVAMAELMLSGCTTSSDRFYIFPNGCTTRRSIEAERSPWRQIPCERAAR